MLVISSHPTPESLVSLGRVVQRSKVRVTVVRPPSIPFGWKVIPQTAEAASVTLRVNLERLNIHFALDGFVMNVELGVNGNLSICASLALPSLSLTPKYSEHLEATEQILHVVL